MARRTPRPTAPFSTTLTPLRETCEACGTRWWVAYHRRRKIMTLEGLWQLTVIIGQCPNPTCPLYHVRYHPEEEWRWALPHGEFGLDVIATIGAWRWRRASQCPRDASAFAGSRPFHLRTRRHAFAASLRRVGDLARDGSGATPGTAAAARTGDLSH
jgi:hypothetical protein